MTDSEIIDALGGTAKVALLCEVEMAAVSQWRHAGIPNARLMFLKLARPDVFGGESPAPYRSTDPTPEPSRSGRQPLSSTKMMSAEVTQPTIYARKPA